jgi:hypothetical protein
MKTFKDCAAQGDLLLVRVKEVPVKFVKAKSLDSRFIVAHSENGHHHIVEDKDDVEYYINPEDSMKAYLVVQNIIGARLAHLREFDTHEALLIPQGIFELRRQREYTPQGWRRVED